MLVFFFAKVARCQLSPSSCGGVKGLALQVRAENYSLVYMNSRVAYDVGLGSGHLKGISPHVIVNHHNKLQYL